MAALRLQQALAGFGIYNASKFALEGFSEALAQEVEQLGIAVTIVEPDPFHTGFAGTTFKEAVNQIDDYKSTAGVFRKRIKLVEGAQEGDPEKAAQEIFNLIEETPTHLGFRWEILRLRRLNPKLIV